MVLAKVQPAGQGSGEVDDQGPAGLLHGLRSLDVYTKSRLSLLSFLDQQPSPLDPFISWCGELTGRCIIIDVIL